MNGVKVAHLTSVYEPPDVGIFHEECRSLTRNGHEVTLIGPHGKHELVDRVGIKFIRQAEGRLTRMT